MNPQIPKEVQPPKFKDNEGLGHTIPIENIGAIAATVASGGLYGASVASIEALLTRTLLSSGENIAGAAVGGAVAGGVNYALGNTGEIGHVTSGVAGGLAGRTITTEYKIEIDQ